jgi:PKD repeat protein
MEFSNSLFQRYVLNLTALLLGVYFILGSNTGPKINILGENPVTIAQGETYQDAGATGSDEVDGELKVITTGKVDTSTPGTYTITYTVTNSLGETATATRTVIVADKEAPKVVADDGNTITDITQALSFSVTDASSIKADSLVIKINGDDRSSLGKYDNGKIKITPDAANYWQVGKLVVAITLADSVSNSNTTTFTYVVKLADKEAPKVVADDGNTITDITQALSFSVTDASSIKADSLVIKINGSDRSSLGKYDNGKIKITPDAANYWQAGSLIIAITLADTASNSNTTTFTYIVQPVTSALPIAKPSSGFAPLRVRFTPFNTTNSAITSYEWDFDNDGTFDRRETVGRDQTYTFNTPGIHTVTLKIIDASGNEITGTVDIDVKNKPPVVSATASPSNGAVPLAVNFTATAQDNEGIALYEWDFKGDGTFDVSDASASTTSFTYTTKGKYQPILRVKDKLGVSTTYSFPDIEVQTNPENYPTVSLSASPQSGDAPLTVNFRANSSASGSRTLDRWEWDFDGDGTYDKTTTEDNSNHTYTVAGDYYVRVRVTDSDNQSSEDVVKVVINASVSLSLSTDTIDTNAKDKVTIKTVLGADGIVSVVIEDSFGTVVKTLVPKGERKAGSYDDEWAGDNDKGNPVAEGEYRAVLLYEVGGVEKRLDLSTTTGGSSYSPGRTRIPNSFQPFAGKPLVFDFTLPKAAEVTAFMGNFRGGAGERLMTFMQRRPMGKGTHRITWNGEDNNGKLIKLPAGETFIIGIFAYRFPDNSIYVRSGANITNIAREPSILVPDSVDNPVTKLTFDLSNKADIRLIIHNAETGKVVATFNFKNLVIGNNEITWDGKNNQGIYVKSGKYRLGITAIDANGYQSMTQYIVQQVYY